MNYERGSEWRKWDLHVHTPKSLVQLYGPDNDETWEKYISDLENLPPEYKVIGINDYIFLDGYKRVLEEKQKGRLSNIDLLLPVIELRVDKFASQGSEAWKKVNLHLIFSNEIDVETIQIQFLYAIQSKATIYSTGEKISGVVTYDFLEKLGKQVKDTSDVPISDTNIMCGFSNLVFDYEKVHEALRSSYFKGKYLTAIGKSEWDKMRWDASAASKKTIVNEADFLFHALNTPLDYKKHVDSLKSKRVNSKLLDCSDAHSFSDSKQKDRIGNSFTWLKADTTFEGLKQVSNDISRIFVGDEPESLVRLRTNKTKFLKELEIKKIDGSPLTEKWFEDFNIPLNHSMVAIIGNKGNGKSAIADTIGLIGSTPNYEYFSFLNKYKFRRKKPTNKSEHFEGKLTWHDSSTSSSILSVDPNSSSIEKVKYIPQGFLEKLCNEEVEDFEDELREVIFSHLSDQEKLDQENLDSLIEFKTQFVIDEIENIKGEISKVNRKIIDLEEKESPDYLKEITEKLQQKKNEKNEHFKLKPQVVKPPTDKVEIDRNKDISKQIEFKREEYKVEFKFKKEKEKSIGLSNIRLEKTKRVLQAIESFENQFNILKSNISDDLNDLDLKFQDVVSVAINKKELQLMQKTEEANLLKWNSELNDPTKGIIVKLSNIELAGKKLTEQLDKSSKTYQKYLEDLSNWNKKQIEYDGNEDKIDSIKYYEAQLKYLESTLSEEIEFHEIKREELVKSLFSKKLRIIDIYKTLFKPVSDFILTYKEVLDDYHINLDVDFKIQGFVDKFFDHISLGSKGSFIGNPSGIEKLKSIVERSEISSSEGIIKFLSELVKSLKYDQRKEYKNQKRYINRQLKNGYTKANLYSFLFELDFLEPEYRLKLGEKNISELSPGERGALLLIFYLTIDQNDIPLIIDQPEENLDNQSVFKILVQFIIKAKEKRQIIIVTHNPNLAVACNAEQIVHIQIDKKNKNLVKHYSGALENETINNAVIDILEGTYPALNTRTKTYNVIERGASI